MATEVDKFLARPHTTPPTDTEILAHIDSIQASVVEAIERDMKYPTAIQNKTGMPTGQKAVTPIPRAIPISENARKIDEWLNEDNTAEDSLLPPK